MIQNNIKLYEKLNKWSKFLTIIVLFISLAVVVEWKFGYSYFKRPLPNRVATNPLTALAFITLAISFLILNSKKKSVIKHNSTRVLFSLVFLIAFLKLISLFPPFDFHIDQFLFSEKLTGEIGQASSNKMSHFTALNFLFLSLALLLLSRPSTGNQQWPMAFVLTVGFIAMFFALGYTYRVIEFKQVLLYFPMSLTTAFCFLFISSAILFAYPQKSFMKRFTIKSSGTTAGKILIPVSIILPIVFGYTLLLNTWNNIFSLEFSAALLVMMAMIIFFTFTWYTIGLLNKNDLLKELAENNLRSINETLELKVAERTKELEIANKDLAEYKIALDASSIIAITNENGIIQYANDNFCNISKYTKEELIGQDHRIISSGYHSKEYIRNLWDTILNGKIWKGEIKNKAKDGSIYWVDTTIYPFLNEQGKPYKYLAIRSDITERKKGEDQLLADQQRTRFLIEHVPAAIAMFDTQMRYIMVSNRWMEDYRLGERNIIGLSHYEIFPEISEQWKEYHRKSLAGEEFRCEEETFVRADGSVEWVKWQLSPWSNAEGRIGGIILFSELITKRKRAETELREKEEKYRDLFENSLSAMFINDISTQKVIAANSKGVQLFGYKSEKEFLNNYNPALHFVHPEDRENNFQVLKEYGALTREQEMKKLDGTHFWSQIFLKFNREKNTVQTVAIDITEEKRSKDKLAVKVKELEKANKELETFNFISSHDLQEPLRKIRNFGSVLIENEKNNLTEEGKHYLTRMTQISNQMQMLIEDLLAYSRTGKGELKFEKTALNKIIEEVISEFNDIISEKKAMIKTDCTCSANVIRFQFRQLITNLISNALKFVDPARRPEIMINCEIVFGNHAGLIPEKQYYQITVADNGIGFDPQYKDRIFDVFERLYGQDKYPGTGIGLAICKKIVENHKGIITANGEYNKGARFDVYIPVE